MARGASPPNMDTGPLEDAWERWKGEGLRAELDPRDYDAWCDAFGWDYWPKSASLARPKPPLYAEETLAEDESTITKRLSDGSIIRDGKGAHKSIYHVVRPAVETEADWERLKTHLEVDAPLPDGTEAWAREAFERARSCVVPLVLQAGSLLGTPRNWLGFEEFAVRQLTEPDFVEDMAETCCRAAEWAVRTFGESGVPVDVVHFWEDICYKNGPIVTPRYFREVAIPRYQRVAGLCREYGYPFMSVDSDGDISALIEGWIEGGVNVLVPFEVQAGMDATAARKRYGRRFAMIGGIHKYRLVGGEKAIAEELRRVKPLVKDGGYIPMLDHNVPSDVSLPNYLAYCRLKREILEVGTPFDPSRVLR